MSLKDEDARLPFEEENQQQIFTQYSFSSDVDIYAETCNFEAIDAKKHTLMYQEGKIGKYSSSKGNSTILGC